MFFESLVTKLNLKSFQWEKQNVDSPFKHGFLFVAASAKKLLLKLTSVKLRPVVVDLLSTYYFGVFLWLNLHCFHSWYCYLICKKIFKIIFKEKK